MLSSKNSVPLNIAVGLLKLERNGSSSTFFSDFRLFSVAFELSDFAVEAECLLETVPSSTVWLDFLLPPFLFALFFDDKDERRSSLLLLGFGNCIAMFMKITIGMNHSWRHRPWCCMRAVMSFYWAKQINAVDDALARGEPPTHSVAIVW